MSKFAFIISLGIAVELDPRHLFFLVLIEPFFVFYGLFSSGIYATTGYPLLAGTAAAAAFAWAIGVAFPLVSG